MNQKTLFSLLIVCMVGAFFALAAPTWSQETQAGPIHPKPGAPPEKIPAEQSSEQKKKENAIRVRVTEVVAPVTVRNSSGEMVLDLTKEDFHVYDNGAEQKIEHFDLGGDPLSVVLVAETSSHIEPILPAVRQSGIVFTQTVMGQTAEAAVLGYDESNELLHDFTTDQDAIQNTINHLPMGTGGMRLYDAMAKGIALLEKRPEGRRRVLVVVGEAQDAGSQYALGEVLRYAQFANVTIYSIGLSTTMADLRAKPGQQHGPSPIGPPGTYPIPLPPGQPPTPDAEDRASAGVGLGNGGVGGNIDFLALAALLVRTGKNALGKNSLAIAGAATGGLHLNTMKDRSIQKAMDEIGGELHSQYTLGYRPSGDEPSGYHEIKITVDRPGVTLRTRPGYYLAPTP